MKKRSSSATSNRRPKSRTDWARVKSMREEDIDTSDSPEITPDIADKGVWRVNGKPVARGKTRLTMYLDNVLVEYFKAKAGPRGYQTLINEALKEAIQRESLEGTLRRVLREEVAAYELGKTAK